MKNIKRSALIIAVLLLIVVAIPSPMHAESLTKHSLSAEAESWYYPVLPGDEEWNKMSMLETFAICDMPESLLKNSSTEHLAKLVLDYPFLLDIRTYDETADGVEHLMRKSNIIREFFSRANAIDILLDEYGKFGVDYDVLSLPIGSTKRSLLVESGYNKEAFVQAYIGTNYMKLSENQLSRFSEIFERKCDEQKKHKNSEEFPFVFYTSANEVLGYIPTVAISAGAVRENESSALYGDLVDDFDEVQTLPAVQVHNQNFTYTVGYHISSLYGGLSILAKKLDGSDFSDLNRQKADEDFMKAYIGFTYISSASAAYNCHCYTWTPNVRYYIEEPEVIYDSDYFAHVGSNCAANLGDKIVTKYSSGSPVHSVIVTGAGASAYTIMTTAKMGYQGVYSATLYLMMNFYSGTSSYDVYR